MNTFTPNHLLLLLVGLWALLALSACGEDEPIEEPPVCENTCATADDGVCDDGGEGADFDSCAYGSDCGDCGERRAADAPTAPLALEPLCDDSCPTANDGVCEDSVESSRWALCRPGTDCSDCGPRLDSERCERDEDCGLWQVCGPKLRCVTPEYHDHTERILLTQARVAAGDLVEASIDLPEDTASALLLVEAANTRAEITLEKVFAPIGQLIYDGNAPSSSRISFLPNGVGGQFAIFLRNSPEYVFRSGSHRLQISASVATEVSVTALLKRLPAEPQGGRLQVNLWFPNNFQVDATTAPENRHMKVMLRELRRIFSLIDLELHEVTYNNLAGSYANALGVPQSTEALCSDMREAMTAANLPGVNVVMVRHFGEGGLLGLSCGIPGFPSWPGVSRSGVTVAGYLLDRDPWLLGSVTAHEIGHFLGLFHTTESHGQLHDPIEDTLECPMSQDLDRSWWLSADECIDHGAIYNMFWSGPQENDFAQHTTTEGQRFVLMRNPMVETY